MLPGFFQLPPLHPVLIHFPLALIPVALVCDAIGKWRNNVSLTHAAWWSMLFATLAAPLTAASGWLWLRQMGDMDHSELVYHQWLGTALPILLIPIAWWRFCLHGAQRTVPNSHLSVLGFALLAVMIQGHLGGMMSFGNEASPDMQAPPASQPAEQGGHHHNMDNMQGMPNASPATSPATEDGWGTSIKVQEHHHEHK